MVQLIVREHVFAVLNDQSYIHPISFPAKFAKCKEKVERAGGSLEFGGKEQLVNSVYSFYSRFF